jgi:hypothetical protein
VHQQHGKLGVPLHCVSDLKEEGGGGSAVSASCLRGCGRFVRLNAAGPTNRRWSVLD